MLYSKILGIQCEVLYFITLFIERVALCYIYLCLSYFCAQKSKYIHLSEVE